MGIPMFFFIFIYKCALFLTCSIPISEGVMGLRNSPVSWNAHNPSEKISLPIRVLFLLFQPLIAEQSLSAAIMAGRLTGAETLQTVWFSDMLSASVREWEGGEKDCGRNSLRVWEPTKASDRGGDILLGAWNGPKRGHWESKENRGVRASRWKVGLDLSIEHIH